jgi:hypothetical protein
VRMDLISRVSRHSPEQRAKVARMVVEATPDYPSQWAAIESVADKIGASSRDCAQVGPPRRGRWRAAAWAEQRRGGRTRNPPVPPISVGTSRSTSSRPSDVRACPSRPPSVVASAVYRTHSIMRHIYAKTRDRSRPIVRIVRGWLVPLPATLLHMFTARRREMATITAREPAYRTRHRGRAFLGQADRQAVGLRHRPHVGPPLLRGSAPPAYQAVLGADQPCPLRPTRWCSSIPPGAESAAC